MAEASADVRVTLRIPGVWEHPGKLLERMPAGYRLTPERLFLPDGSEVEFTPMPPDKQFAGIFKSSCRRPATQDELNRVGRYTVNICLSGPGGSLEAASTMMQAGAAIIRAGGAGVFIDNSALSHGGGDWLEMADDGSSDALSFGYVSIVHGQQDVWTIGMHVLGFPEFLMSRADVGGQADRLVDVIRYVCSSDVPVCDGHLIADELGPRFRATATETDRRTAGSCMHNPFGRLRLMNLRTVAEGN